MSPAPLIFVKQLQVISTRSFRKMQPGTATVVVITADGLESQAAMVNVNAVEPGTPSPVQTRPWRLRNADNSAADSAAPPGQGGKCRSDVRHGLGPFGRSTAPQGRWLRSNPPSNATVVSTVTIG